MPLKKHLSLPFFLLALLFAYRLVSPKTSGIFDPDFWWHIEYGRLILAQGLPTTDTWSWTVFGTPYHLTQWGGEVLMGLVWNLFGTTGTGFLASLLLTCTVAASWRAALSYLDGDEITALIIAFFCSLALLTMPARPQNFTLLTLALLSWILVSYEHGNKRALYWLPPLFLLWVNLHGGFAFGLLVLGVVVLCRFVRAYVQQESAFSATKPLLVASTLAALATLLNPYGFGAWQSVIEVAQLQSASLDLISEWKATSIKNFYGHQYFCVVAALFAAAATARQRLPLDKLLYVIALMALGWQAVRLSMMVSVLLAPIIASLVATTPLYARLRGSIRPGNQRQFLKVILVVIMSWTVFQYMQDSGQIQRLRQNNIPAVVVEFLLQNNLTQKVLNEMEIGGYLIHHGIPVSIDTRLDLYGDEAFFAFQNARAGRPGWDEYIARLNPNIVLMKLDAPLSCLLIRKGFTPIASGGAFVVLAKETDFPAIELVKPCP